MKLEIYLPDEMEPYKEDMEFFVSLMVRKLHTNRHKGTAKSFDLDMLMEMAEQEMIEVQNAMKNEGQFETAVECADVANFMFLVAMGSLQMTRQDFKDGTWGTKNVNS